jgi:hypothetical protein
MSKKINEENVKGYPCPPAYYLADPIPHIQFKHFVKIMSYSAN